MRDLFRQLSDSRPDPVRSARNAMRDPLPRRFYEKAGIARGDGGFAVVLDSRPVRTPGRNVLELPTEPAAAIVAGEFEAQRDRIDPARMPATRLANTVIDGIAPDMQPVVEDIVRYVGSDLLCYRAGSPAELVARQTDLWDPVLDWLRSATGANLVLAEGLMPVAQPREAVAAVAARVRAHAEPFRIGCIHVMTTLTGSAVLALAVAEGHLSPRQAWEYSLVDEDWNIAQWGEDAEAARLRAAREADMLAAGNLLAALDDRLPE